MHFAVVLIAIVLASVLFHLVSPWWTTPLASNWQSMDDTLTITLLVTGVFFVVINLFLAYTLLRFRHRDGARAAYEPENKRLERWLIGITTLGIVALLAPGLLVYANYVSAPRDALVLEVLGQQWQWRYRFPGTSGKLGFSDPRFVSASNPFGLDATDPASQANILVNSNEVHLPLGKPVKVLLRSHDVLHDFYVPPIRARMNMVPGMVTSFWFTPTLAGRYEVLCAQLCGVGHSQMRGAMVVEDEAQFQAWLKAQPTFAMTLVGPASTASTSAGSVGSDATKVSQGQALYQSKGCVACHTVDGSPRLGPTWKGLYGKQETMQDGSTALVDEAYLRSFILDPQARSVKGFQPIMPKIELSDEELAALLTYIQSLGGPVPADTAQKAQR
ncbi:cytochrome c oxidase subunit II [Acidovorax sp. Be4]|uniref:cytochrome-c oxidase n=1 Tax=Acidovorax bellezanensis TaxID=2976702 RepID=A0ABT2PN76_9BURK|nr:cytochrome c oxidase subunit II [Acidovorax sp. Be4]MCT9811930.1 cytochrome c oxidase subunit II [Acidovorax sp. Be4]